MSSNTQPKLNYPAKAFLKDFWLYTSGFHSRLVFWLLVRTASPLIALLNPVITAQIVDHLTSHTATPQYLLNTLAIFFFLNIFRTILRNRSNFQVERLGHKIRLKVRQQGIGQLLDFDLAWHEKQSSGKKVTVITKGADALRQLIRFIRSGDGLIEIFVNVVVVLIIFLTLDWRYFLLALANAFVYLYTNHLNNRGINPKKHRLNIHYEKVIGKNFEYFSSMNLIKSLGIGHQVNRVLFRKENAYTNQNIKVDRLSFDKWLQINFISQVFAVITLALVVFDIYRGHITLGSFFIYTGYLNRLQDGLSSIVDLINDVIDNQLAFLRMIQLLNSGVQQTNCGHQNFPQKLDTLTFNHLNFSYKKSLHPTLSDISLTINAGDKVGLVGVSGSGKSSLTKLLLRLYLANSGQIYFNETHINSIDPEELHRHLAVAPQDSDILNLTFKENITVASDNLKFDPDLYHLALNTSECQPILDKIKNNHSVLLGEKGVKLSGGERQRLGIARAIYKNSPIMIFDESTSSLDSKTEDKILNHLETNLKDKTIIWIAHRLSTLRFTNKIFVFDKGKIVETGDFNQLIKKHGYFYQLWQIQKRTKLKQLPPTEN